jgi:alginate O-acetyltransferase complex protein AlgI
MDFCSQRYVLFLSAVLAAYWAMPAGWVRPRTWLLLAASFFFYASWNSWLALVVAASATLDWLLALGLDRPPADASAKSACEAPPPGPDRLRRGLLAVSVAVNLGLLAYFKYAGFFLGSLESALRAAGLETAFPTLSVLAPIGISFYTFEAISYTVDVYAGRVRAERSLPNFLLFITFFPHLVCGPIVRARDLLPQIRREKRLHWRRVQVGVELLICGAFKKLAVADRMAEYSDPVFAAPGDFHSGAVRWAVLAYALRIYADFSGYSDMATGAAHLLGFRLTENFRTPYAATSIAEFWRRWHMSLSGWLRDYLFIPLGGSRAGPARTAANLMITMTLGGLWHGASWTFVLWGVYHGLLLVLHRLWRGLCERTAWLDRAMHTLPAALASAYLTFGAVCVGWVLFRATSLANAEAVLWRLFAFADGRPQPLAMSGLYCTLAVVAAWHVPGVSESWPRVSRSLPAAALGFLYAAALFLATLLRPEGGRAFIYFQF